MIAVTPRCRFCKRRVTQPKRRIYCSKRCHRLWETANRRALVNMRGRKRNRASNETPGDLSARAIESIMARHEAWQRYQRNLT
jgi:hypothetical protein